MNPTIRRRLRAFWLGMKEFRSAITTNFGPSLIRTYDRGREFMHVLTLRYYEQE